MVERFFYWSGVLAWVILLPTILGVLLFCLSYWFNRVFLPSIGNLLFVFFGIRRFTNVWFIQNCPAGMAYYDAWRGVYGWGHRYYTRGYGAKYFGREAYRKFVLKARKEMKNGIRAVA